MKNISFSPLTLAVLGLLSSGTAFSAGFQLQNQNGAGTGLAYAGQAANAEDASTIYFNPAGMAMLPEGHNMSLGGTIIGRSVRFTDNGTTPHLANPTIGGSGGDGGGQSLIPSGFYSYTLSSKIRLGVGVSVPYGSKTEYTPDYAGRYSAYYTSIEVLNINPSISYKVDDSLMLGFGVNFAKAELELRQMAPLGGADRRATLHGKDSAVGWNVGLIYKMNPQTLLGLSYRSKLDFKLNGTQDIEVFVPTRGIRADLTTPDNFSAAISHKLSNRTEVLGDLTWTGWSSVQALTAYVSSSGALAGPPLRFNYKDTWRVGVGVKHQYNANWNLRAGVAFDKSPVPNAQSRTMTVPDSDRTWLSVGARYKLSEKSNLDLGYAHIMLKDSTINRAVTDNTGAITYQTINGSFKTKVNLFSAQYNVNF